MVTKSDFDAAIAQINTAASNIADDITRLTNQLQGVGLTPDEQQAALDELNAVAARLKQIADITPDPAPAPTPNPAS